MARAAKVPKAKRRYRFAHIGWSLSVVQGKSFYAHPDNATAGRRIARALNLIEAIERGELIVKEAE